LLRPGGSCSILLRVKPEVPRLEGGLSKLDVEVTKLSGAPLKLSLPYSRLSV
jgi:hypothetical protein